MDPLAANSQSSPLQPVDGLEVARLAFERYVRLTVPEEKPHVDLKRLDEDLRKLKQMIEPNSRHAKNVHLLVDELTNQEELVIDASRYPFLETLFPRIRGKLTVSTIPNSRLLKAFLRLCFFPQNSDALRMVIKLLETQKLDFSLKLAEDEIHHLNIHTLYLLTHLQEPNLDRLPVQSITTNRSKALIDPLQIYRVSAFKEKFNRSLQFVIQAPLCSYKDETIPIESSQPVITAAEKIPFLKWAFKVIQGDFKLQAFVERPQEKVYIPHAMLTKLVHAFLTGQPVPPFLNDNDLLFVRLKLTAAHQTYELCHLNLWSLDFLFRHAGEDPLLLEMALLPVSTDAGKLFPLDYYREDPSRYSRVTQYLLRDLVQIREVEEQLKNTVTLKTYLADVLANTKRHQICPPAVRHFLNQVLLLPQVERGEIEQAMALPPSKEQNGLKRVSHKDYQKLLKMTEHFPALQEGNLVSLQDFMGIFAAMLEDDPIVEHSPEGFINIHMSSCWLISSFQALFRIEPFKALVNVNPRKSPLVEAVKIVMDAKSRQESPLEIQVKVQALLDLLKKGQHVDFKGDEIRRFNDPSTFMELLWEQLGLSLPLQQILSGAFDDKTPYASENNVGTLSVIQIGMGNTLLNSLNQFFTRRPEPLKVEGRQDLLSNYSVTDKIGSIPPFLVIQTKRKELLGYSDTPISFNPDAPLDLTPFLKSGSAQYRLKSYILYHPLGAHYTAHVRMETGEWLSFNDSRPPQRVAHLQHETAYMLFFEKL